MVNKVIGQCGGRLGQNFSGQMTIRDLVQGVTARPYPESAFTVIEFFGALKQFADRDGYFDSRTHFGNVFSEQSVRPRQIQPEFAVMIKFEILVIALNGFLPARQSRFRLPRVKNRDFNHRFFAANFRQHDPRECACLESRPVISWRRIDTQ